MNVFELSDTKLQNVIDNHRRHGETGLPLYREALEEREKRRGKGLEFSKSLSIILGAAKTRRYLSYKELADASGANWSQVHYSVGGHLFNLIEYCHRMGWPLLSAIVVNKPNVSTGEMEPETLKGFVGGVRALGITVHDEKHYLQEEQARVFAWAQNAPPIN